MVKDAPASDRPRDQFGRYTVLADPEDDNGPQENLGNETENDVPGDGFVETKEEDGIASDVRTRDVNAFILSLSDAIVSVLDTVNDVELTEELATKLPDDQSPLSSKRDPPPTTAAVLVYPVKAKV